MEKLMSWFGWWWLLFKFKVANNTVENKTSYRRDRLIRRNSYQVRFVYVPLGKTKGTKKQIGNMLVPLLLVDQYFVNLLWPKATQTVPSTHLTFQVSSLSLSWVLSGFALNTWDLYPRPLIFGHHSYLWMYLEEVVRDAFSKDFDIM